MYTNIAKSGSRIESFPKLNYYHSNIYGFMHVLAGEDRWLSTLLLQRGYRVEYVAASDAFTYAPETFHEFFNQRRRWGPSTIANIVDLIKRYLAEI